MEELKLIAKFSVFDVSSYSLSQLPKCNDFLNLNVFLILLGFYLINIFIKIRNPYLRRNIFQILENSWKEVKYKKIIKKEKKKIMTRESS